MAELKRLPLDKILVADRLRDIDEEHAKMIGLSMAEHGLQNPITIRATPAAERPFTLVTGGHRYRGAELLGWSEIDALVVKASAVDAQLLEITENLHRNELSVIDRAIFVRRYRELWEEKHGKIAVGRPSGNRANLAQLSGDEQSGQRLLIAGEGFADHVADRLGISHRSAKRLDQIARHLHTEVRAALRGTALADNQSTLLKLAKLEPSKQRQAAIALRRNPDLKAALAMIDDRPRPAKPSAADEQAQILAKLTDAWSRAHADTKREFLNLIGVEIAGDLEDAA